MFTLYSLEYFLVHVMVKIEYSLSILSKSYTSSIYFSPSSSTRSYQNQKTLLTNYNATFVTSLSFLLNPQL